MSDLTPPPTPIQQAGELIRAQQHREAMPIVESILRHSPRDHSALQAWTICCNALGEGEREVALLEEIAPNAGDDATFLAFHAQALATVGRFDESLRGFERAVALCPGEHDFCVAFAMSLLRQGEFARGWDMYEHRESMPEVARFSQQVKRPRYTGGNLKGHTILLLAEQGLGDTLMFGRYATLLAKRGGRVIMAAHPEIADLVRTIAGVERVIRFGENSPPFHTYARLLNLPRIFGTTLWNIPHEVPYIRAAWGRVERWRNQLATDGAKKRVGLVWAGSARHSNDVYRSMHLSDLSMLADAGDVTFYALQKGARSEEAQNPPPNMRLIDLGPQIKDLSDLAAVLEVLDLLIAVDTAPAHLAGALGKPVWTLLPHSPDWRWMLARSDSPWYPTMRLFRQVRLGDWNSAVTETTSALRTLVS